MGRRLRTNHPLAHLGLLAAVLCLAACDDVEPPVPEALPDNPFQRQMEQPAWLTSVEAPTVTTAQEVDELWRSRERCCVSKRKLLANNREFYKACYQAIGRHFDDDELVVHCLWLMDAGAERDQRRQIKQFLVDHYFDHRRRVDNCANCSPADIVARVSRELALIELASGRAGEATELLERVLDQRLEGISAWVQTEVYETLGRIYLASEVTESRQQRLRAAYERLGALAERDETVARRLDGLAEVYGQVSER